MARAARVSAPRKALLLAGAILACLAQNLVLAPLVHAAPSAAAAPGFDAAEAQRLLLALCVGGPRIAGSQAASAAVALLLRELGAVSELARAAGATLEFEAVDSGHGSFETDFLDGFTNSYQGVVSVAARLTWPGAAREAVLLSSHFDTWSSSPGASDDAVHVATTVGVLRALAVGPARGVSVLAFFSGAEESNWVAAHAFATRHRWAADYRAVLNLEAIGAGGDLVAFQMGPRAGWLASALGDAGTQRGSVFAHDLFQIPGFPAGDDFKTLVAHAPHRGGAVRVTGVDFATIEAGYHYHTPLDQPVDTGGYPQMRSHGEGLLAKTRAAMAGLRRELDAAAADGGNGGAAGGERGARAPHENEQTVDGPSDVVYFDLYGLAWVTYSASTGAWLHLLAAATALGAIAVTGAGPGRAAAELAAMVGALLAAALVGGLVAAAHPLATYGRPVLAAGAYGGSALAVSLAVRLRLTRRAGAPEPAESGKAGEAASKAGKAASKAGKAATEAKGARLLASAPSSAAVAAGATPGEGSRRAAAAALVPWLLALLPMQACGLGSAYLPAYYLGVNGAALLGAAAVAVSSPAAAAALQLCGALLPTVHAAELCRQLIAVLLPITARSGAVLPTDPLVAVVYAVTAVCTSSVLVAPLPRRVAARSAGGLGLASVCCVCFALGSRASPFTDATPKRLVVQHIYRELEGAHHSSGLWVSAFDFSGLRELRETPAAAALLPAVAARTPYACDLDPLTPAPPPAAGRLLFDPPVRPTGCYLSLPFYFPLGGVLGTPDGQGAVFATTVAGRSVKPPPIPQRKRVRIERTGAAAGPEPGSRTLSLRVSGPSHMGVAAPETRVLAWSFAAAEAPRPPVPRRSPFAPDERLHFAFLTCGSGGGAEPCLWDLTLVVNGSAPLPLAVTGHYPDIADTPELEALSEALPTELRADWHWFSSMVQRVDLPVGGAETVAYS